MRNIHFYLPRPKSQVNTIRFKFTICNQKVTGSTKIKIESNNWDSRRIRTKPSYRNSALVNNKLIDIENKITSILDDLMIEESLNKEEFKLKFYGDNEKLSINTDVFKFHKEYFIPNKKSQGVTTGTIKAHLNTIKKLEDYCSYAKIEKTKLTLKSIMDLTFYYSYMNYLSQECGHMLNYQGGLIKNLKAIINHAAELGLHNQVLSKSYMKPVETIEPVILEKEELASLIKCSTLNRIEEVARDWFILSCCSGLRISDFLKLNLNMIDLKRNEIRLRTTKNKSKFVIIPIANEFRKVLTKYNDNLPPKISEGKFNEHIKIACKKANINSMVEIERKIKGVQVKNVVKKHQKISAHCGRRTFATLASEAKILPLDELALITGHSDVKTLKLYIRYDLRKIAQKMQVNMSKAGW